jgi:acyl-CoA thioester hydrolase
MNTNYELIIRESHLDTFGHVNNATYLQLFEEARWELITNNGYGLNMIRKTGHGPVILEVTIKFLRELKLRDKIKITTEMIRYEAKIGVLKQKVYRENDELACEADFTFALFDTLQRKIVLPTPEWLNAIQWQAK